MHENLKHAEEGYSHHVAHRSDAIVGTSNGGGKSNPKSLLASSSSGNDELQANSDLLAAWTQRLQILTVVTSFLVSTDGMLFSLSALNTQIGLSTGTARRELVYSCLSGALVLHVCACMLGYIASFALINYRIIDASEEEEASVGDPLPSSPGATKSAQRPSRRVIMEPAHRLRLFSFMQPPEIRSSAQSLQSVSPPSMSFLSHCYYTTLCLTTAGSILALTGILAYVWVGLPMSVGIFSTVCLGVGLIAAVWALAM